MKAIAVTPGTRNSIHLQDIPKPSVDDVPAAERIDTTEADLRKSVQAGEQAGALFQELREKSSGFTKKLPLQFVTKHFLVLFASRMRTYAESARLL